MIRYNIPKVAEPGTYAPTMARAPVSTGPGGRPNRHAAFGAASILIHAFALGGLLLIVTPPPEPAALQEQPVEMVFEQPPAAPAQPEPASEAPAPETPAPETPAPETPAPETPAPETPAPEPAPVPIPPPEPPVPPRQAVTEPERLPLPPVPLRAVVPPPPPPARPEPNPPRPSPRPPRAAVAPSEVRKPAAPPSESAAPRAAEAPPAAPATSGMTVDPRWQAEVAGWLASRKAYPEAARMRGEEGRVAVRFTVDRSGRVVDAAIVSPSGFSALDDAALALLRQAVFPAFPADMSQPRITITTTVRYSLR